MRQLYYTVQILLRGRGSNFIKLVSLTLGLLIGILLFSQIVYELSYESIFTITIIWWSRNFSKYVSHCSSSLIKFKVRIANHTIR